MTATPHPVAAFYDALAADYHLVYVDWDAAVARQGAALDRLLRERLAAPEDGSSGEAGAYDVLDCSCGIGTQAIGLALRGHRLTATDISAVAVARAAREARARGAAPRLAAVADMRQLPFAGSSFDAVVCADNSLPHLLTEEDVLAALSGMRRVLRPGGALVLTVRPYDAILRERPRATPPQVTTLPGGRRTMTFQLWHWHDDGERYDLEHIQLLPDSPGGKGSPGGTDRTDNLGGTDRTDSPGGTDGTDSPRGTDRTDRTGRTREAGGASDADSWRVAVRRATYWAISRERLTALVTAAGFTDLRWEDPDDAHDAHDALKSVDAPGSVDTPEPGVPGFHQPVLTATAAAGPSPNPPVNPQARQAG